MSAEADVLPVLERIAAAARPDGVVVAGVSGIDCAGKSTYASRLAKQLPPMLAENAAIHVLTIDDFCRPRQERYRNADQALGYYRDSFDYETFFGSLLEPLKKDGRVDASVHTLDWENEAAQRRRFVIHPPSVVIVEGVFLFQQRYRELFDLKIWLETSFDTALERALERPKEIAHYHGAEAIAAKYRERFFPGQRLHIETDRPRVHSDLIVSTDSGSADSAAAPR